MAEMHAVERSDGDDCAAGELREVRSRSRIASTSSGLQQVARRAARRRSRSPSSSTSATRGAHRRWPRSDCRGRRGARSPSSSADAERTESPTCSGGDATRPCCESVERERVRDVERPAASAAERGEVCGALREPPKVARERANVRAAAAVMRAVDGIQRLRQRCSHAWTLHARGCERERRAAPRQRHRRARRPPFSPSTPAEPARSRRSERARPVSPTLAFGGGAVRVTVPVRSSVSVSAPKRIVASVHLRFAVDVIGISRVPRPTSTTSRPGSKWVERAGVSNAALARRAAHHGDDVVRGDARRFVDEQQAVSSVAHPRLGRAACRL